MGWSRHSGTRAFAWTRNPEIMGARFRVRASRAPERRKPSLLREALHKRLAALHLVGERRFVDLDHDGFGVDAEILDQRLRDVAHHAGLLFFGAAGGHVHGNFGHFGLSLLFPSWPFRPSTISSIKHDVDARHKACARAGEAGPGCRYDA